MGETRRQVEVRGCFRDGAPKEKVISITNRNRTIASAQLLRQLLREMAQSLSDPVVDPLWYKDAVSYELHVKTFHDSNGDGIGDFRGLVEKLDYLQELGVTALWL